MTAISLYNYYLSVMFLFLFLKHSSAYCMYALTSYPLEIQKIFKHPAKIETY